MMELKKLLENCTYEILRGTPEKEISDLSRDNRKAKPGDLFICTKGARFDTHDEEVITGLLKKGVRAFLVEKEIQIPEGDDITVIKVPDTRKAGAKIFGSFYDHPDQKMNIIGITGSKGKTTTTHMLASVLSEGGRDVATMGTNGVLFHGKHFDLLNTTPDYDELMMYLSQMAEEKIDTCILEVSSQAIKKHRVDDVDFDYGIFLNIQEGDHVGPNEHETFEDYLYCKAQLLNRAKKSFTFRDDPYYDDLVKLLDKEAETFGTAEGCAYRLLQVSETFDEETKKPGIEFTVSGKLQGKFQSNFPGVFNGWNALVALMIANEMGVNESALHEGLRDVQIRGRNDIVYDGDFKVVVDFAHNGASAFAHLEAMRAFRPKRLICIFGADGNRSKGRRYGMGEAAGRLADFSIVTSGHNRFESFEDILKDTEVGLHRAEHPNYIAIKDRKTAISYAIDHREPGDLITIIGLGHENWQEENGKKIQYSDIEFVKELLKKRGIIK